MIKLIDNISQLDFLPADPFAVKIHALALTYGTEYDFILFYVQYIDDAPVSALCKFDGNITLFCSEKSDFDELNEFISAVGYNSLQLDHKYCERFSFKPIDSSYIVKYSGNKLNAPQFFSSGCNYKEVYKLLIDSGFDIGNFNYFISDIAVRINKKTATFGSIRKDKLLCCAFRLFEDNKTVLLGSVATLKSERGNGLASSLVPYMTDENKDNFLFCRNDNLLKFYSDCGFKIWGKWALCGSN